MKTCLKNLNNYILLLFVFTTMFLSCGYGYTGDLPELGKSAKQDEINKNENKRKQQEPIHLINATQVKSD